MSQWTTSFVRLHTSRKISPILLISGLILTLSSNILKLIVHVLRPNTPSNLSAFASSGQTCYMTCWAQRAWLRFKIFSFPFRYLRACRILLLLEWVTDERVNCCVHLYIVDDWFVIRIEVFCLTDLVVVLRNTAAKLGRSIYFFSQFISSLGHLGKLSLLFSYLFPQINLPRLIWFVSLLFLTLRSTLSFSAPTPRSSLATPLHASIENNIYLFITWSHSCCCCRKPPIFGCLNRWWNLNLVATTGGCSWLRLRSTATIFQPLRCLL